ncbi:MAG: spermidine synthase [Archangium sp.]|nr:spermidine synthase [Archangium sp.]MDP3571110.1 spermidine synthase [Archangium sp.]
MTSRARPLVITLLLLSGATGLVYELTWSKRLANLLGNTGQAHAIVLSTFMGGLALGAFLFGRRADRSKRPLSLYGVLELGIGLYALAFPRVLEVAGELYLRIAPGLSGAPRLSARLALAASALLIPTLLMGGTLPVLMRHLTEKLGSARRELSILYAVNSLGASVGCLFAGMLLVPGVGLGVSERLAAMVNLLLGLAAVVAGWNRVATPSENSQSTGDVPAFGLSAVRAALVGTALAGFTSMTYETVWIRVLSIVLGGTSYAFTLILTAFILGISLGSFWLSTRSDENALRTFGRLQLALVFAVLISMTAYARLPYAFMQVHARLDHGPQTWGTYQVLSFLVCGALLLPPTFLLGASFPAAARVALRAMSDVGARLGTTYLWNTIGTVSGALLGGLVLLPLIGLEGTLALALVANLIAAGWALLADGSGVARKQALSLLVPAAVALVLAVVGTSGWASTLAASGRYREWNRSFDSYAQFLEEVKARSTIRFYRDDVFASVLVGTQDDDRRYLRINGKVDGSNGTDIDTQILAAHLGVLMHPREVKRVLLVGVGAGITAGSLLAHPIERLDVVEISPAVVEAAAIFKPDHHDAFNDPRCVVHIEDARTFLQLSTEPYDLIVSVPSNPWVSGVSGLFSKDFFEMAKSKLAPGGRLVQWIHTYESSVSLVKLVVRTLRGSFEHGTTWVGPDDLVLVASREPQVFDLQTLTARMAQPKVQADLARIHLQLPTTLLGRQVHGDEAQKRFGGEGLVNTDDHNLLEYGSPIAYFVAADVRVPDSRRLPEERGSLELAKVLAGRSLSFDEAKDLYASLSWVHPSDDPLVRAAAAAWFEADVTSVEAAGAFAAAVLRQGDVMRAREVLEPFIHREVDSPDVLATWLEATRRLSTREGAPWHTASADVADAEMRARKSLETHPHHVRLGELLAQTKP